QSHRPGGRAAGQALRRRVSRQGGRGLALPHRSSRRRPGPPRLHRALHGRPPAHSVRGRSSEREGDRPLLSLGPRRARDLAPSAARLPSRPDTALRVARVLWRAGLHRHAGHPGPALAELHRQRAAGRVALLLRRQPRLPAPRQHRFPAALRRPHLAAGHRLPATEGVVDLQTLRAGLRGVLLQPGDAGYDAARQVWNGAIDRKPGLIARCTGAGDVIRAVEFAREQRLLVSVRGGGHNVTGNAVCDGGLMIDLSPMKGIRVDPGRRTVQAQAGVTWGDLDHETQAFGLATTGGQISTTGIAGLTLGGGLGWLMRKCGLVVDNLLSADVVLADGRFLTASATENADLFWGLRGGGGNLGLVTSFEYRLHPIGPMVMGG